MERYTSLLDSDPGSWQRTIGVVNRPSFRLATHLGSGENSDVYALGPRDRNVWYSDSDSDSDDSQSDSYTGSSSRGDECSASDCDGCSNCEGGSGSMRESSDDNTGAGGNSDSFTDDDDEEMQEAGGGTRSEGKDRRGGARETRGVSESKESGSARESKGGDSEQESSEDHSRATDDDEDVDANNNAAVPVDLQTVRVFRNCASSGLTQVIVKVFEHLDDDGCFVPWDLEMQRHGDLGTIGSIGNSNSNGGSAAVEARIDTTRNGNQGPLKVFQSDLECEDYMRKVGLAGLGRYECRELSEGFCLARGNSVMAGFSGFFNESLCHLLLSELVKHDITPHITVALEALRHKNTGYLLMERVASYTLDDIIYEVCRGTKDLVCATVLTKETVVNLVFQTLFVLSVLQKTCNFKHHDLHTNNVFIKEIDENTEFRGTRLRDVQFLHYHLDGHDYFLPNCGLLVKIGDFGMSSLDLHGMRLQRSDMDSFNDNVRKWGTWSSEFVHEEGYDTQLLSSDIPRTCKSACRESKREDAREVLEADERENAARGKDDGKQKGGGRHAQVRAAKAVTLEKKKARKNTKRNVELLVKFFTKLQVESGGVDRNVTRGKKRPIPGRISTRLAADILSALFRSQPLVQAETRGGRLAEKQRTGDRGNLARSQVVNGNPPGTTGSSGPVPVWYDYNAAPVNKRIVSLGDTRWL